MYTYPKIYDAAMPGQFADKVPVMASIVEKTHHVKSPPWYNVSQIVSKGHNKFVSFEKFTNFCAGNLVYICFSQRGRYTYTLCTNLAKAFFIVLLLNSNNRQLFSVFHRIPL